MTVRATTREADNASSSTSVRDVSVHVYNVNDAPTADADEYTFIPNTPLTIDPGSGLLTNDFDEDGDALAVIITKAPQHGTLTIHDDGTFTYVPDQDFFGTDSFEYVVTDGTATSDPANVDIMVGGVLQENPPADPERPDPKFKTVTRGRTIDSVTGSTSASPLATTPPTSSSASIRSDNSVDLAGHQRTGDAISVNRVADGYEGSYVAVRRDVEEIKKESGTDAIEDFDNLNTTSVLWKNLDEMHERTEESSISGRLIVGVASLLVAAGTYAYVQCSFWAGHLITSLMSIMPGWKFLDPLPVLDKQEKEEAEQDPESLASLLDDEE